MDTSVREDLTLKALSDSSSAYYQGIVRMLRVCDANERQARQAKSYVTVPFYLDELDVVALERQFSVVVKNKGVAVRARATPRVAGLFFLLESALLEHASGCGRSVLLIDGDVMSVAAAGLEGRLVERTNATARLGTGYFLEDENLRKFGSNRQGAISVAADVLVREQLAGGGEHFWPLVREDGPRVHSIIVNHMKTPVGPKQLAWLAYKRGAVVFGAFPFQVDMLTQDVGRLNCFPGHYYVDRAHDMLTLVPESDATMSISHPLSSILEIVENNSIVVDGREFLCEKYNSVRGIMYYTLNSVDAAFEAPEVLRTSYFDTTSLGVTEISYPSIKLSGEGVPVGWERASVRILTSRCEKVMTRVATSANDIVTPSEVFCALMDYNNTVVSSLDTVVVADRMSVEDEERVALAIALHVNWTRHAARGTFNTLMNAIRLRHSVKDSGLFGLAFIALSAWWSRPSVRGMSDAGKIPVPEVVDWCGNDFSVVMRDADPWIEVVQTAGMAKESGGKLYDWFPKPPRSVAWLQGLVERVKKKMEKPRLVCESKQSVGSCVFSPPVVVKNPVGQTGPVLVDEVEVCVSRRPCDLTEIKQQLRRKMIQDQGAVREVVPDRWIATRGQLCEERLPSVPVVEVEPVSAIRDDVLMCNGGPFDRSMVATGYRIAEVDVDKVTDGCYSVNDAKRVIPKPRWVRLPKVDAGVEGKRVSSQAALLGALFKRNIGIPSNRGVVDLEVTPQQAVDRVIQTCYRENWQEILERHLEAGLWEPNAGDIDDFLVGLDEKKTKRLLTEFFLEGTVDLHRWLLMAKGKIKASREPEADGKIDHSQTIMYLENSSTNAMFSAMTRRFKECVDECLRPEVSLNAQRSSEEQEGWYNSLESLRKTFPRTFSYAADIKIYDRSQEHVGLKVDLEFYRRHGLSPERLRLWEQTHGEKRAVAMMFGVILTMVLGGVSGLWKTLLRNGIINLTALVVSTGVTRRDIVMLDIKGDDMDAEFSRQVEVETSVERMSLTFNLSAKFFTNDVRYFCKEFRIKLNGRWYFVADPWARVQSLCTPLWIGNQEDDLHERWVSLCADLRHYDNGLLVDAVAEAAQQHYGLERPLYGMARGLAAIKENRCVYFNFFQSPRRVD